MRWPVSGRPGPRPALRALFWPGRSGPRLGLLAHPASPPASAGRAAFAGLSEAQLDRSSCRSLGWLSGLRRAAAASAPARARPRGAPPAGAVARRWAHFCDYACAPSSQHRTPVRAFLGARLRSRCVCSLVSLSACARRFFVAGTRAGGAGECWSPAQRLPPRCIGAEVCARRVRGVAPPPLFGFCRGDWQTRRFARRRGRSPPCQRVRY